MTTSSPILLIIGAGANIGQHVAKAFAAKGYKVALVARKLNESESTPDQVNIQGDMVDPSSVEGIFSKVKTLLGVPSVVVYNAGAVNPNDPKDPLSLPLDAFTRTFQVNTTSALAAAHQAVLGFDKLPENASKTFIYTGNITNVQVIAPLLELGVGKSASAHIIEASALAYKEKGFKFYYCDERKADGSAAYKVDGEAHGKLYTALAEAKSQGPWQQTFVKGVGYKRF